MNVVYIPILAGQMEAVRMKNPDINAIVQKDLSLMALRASMWMNVLMQNRKIYVVRTQIVLIPQVVFPADAIVALSQPI